MTIYLLFFCKPEQCWLFFHSCVKVPQFEHLQNIKESGFKIEDLLSFKIFIETPSGPWALFGSKAWVIFKVLTLMKLTWLNLSSLWYLYEEGRVPSFLWVCITVWKIHWRHYSFLKNSISLFIFKGNFENNTLIHILCIHCMNDQKFLKINTDSILSIITRVASTN